jgi:hypothetical protein
MKFAKTTVLGLTIILVMAAAAPPVLGQAAHVRWDIVKLTFGPNFSPPITFYTGGQASASADDGSHITLTGSGTFVAPGGGNGTSSAATGGGTWQTFDSKGTPTGSGTYNVTGLVRWEVAPGFFDTTVLVDTIDSAAEAHPGLAVLRIEFSDGSHGVLTVSCNLINTPPSVFEGITVSKDFVDYWNRAFGLSPAANPDVTLFHIN